MSHADTSQRALAAALIALLTALAGLTAAVLGMPPEQLAPRTWRGYYTLLVGSPGGVEGSASLAAALLRRPGIDAVVSRHTSPASFNTFAGLATVPVADLSRRLDPRDPRYDPYLRSLPGYFRGETAKGRALEVLYIRCQRSPAWLLRVLARLPEARGADLRLLGYGGGAWLRLALFAAFAGLLIARQRGWLLRLLAAGAALPWVPAVGFGTWLSLLAAMALLPLWPAVLDAAHPFLRERMFVSTRGASGARSARRPGGASEAHRLRAPAREEAGGRGRGTSAAPRALGCLAAAAAVLLLLEAAGQSPGPAVLAGFSGLLLLPLLHAALALEYVLCRHAPFLPLPILASRAAAGRKMAGRKMAGRKAAGGKAVGQRLSGRLTAAAMVGLAALSLPLLAAQSRLNPPRIPAPAGTVEAGLSWQSLRSLERERAGGGEGAGGGELANLADYVSHRAFQEGLAFARPYSFPSPEERLVIPSFLEGASRRELVRADTVALRRDEGWLARTLAGAPAGSVARLLVDQGRAAPVRPRAERGLAVGPAAALLYAFAVLFLGLLLLPQEYDLTALPLCAKRGVASRRRRHAQ